MDSSFPEFLPPSAVRISLQKVMTFSLSTLLSSGCWLEPKYTFPSSWTCFYSSSETNLLIIRLTSMPAYFKQRASLSLLSAHLWIYKKYLSKTHPLRSMNFISQIKQTKPWKSLAQESVLGGPLSLLEPRIQAEKGRSETSRGREWKRTEGKLSEPNRPMEHHKQTSMDTRDSNRRETEHQTEDIRRNNG